MRRQSLLLALLSLLPGRAPAMQPFITDDTGTQGAGGKQIEAALVHEHTRDGGATACRSSLPFVLSYGLSDELDIALGLTHQHLNPPAANQSGTGNPLIGAKYRFYDREENGLSFAIEPVVSLPLSRKDEARGLGTGKASYALSLLATQANDFGTLIATVAAYRVRYRDALLDAAARNNQYLASAAVLWNAGEHWQIGGELGSRTQEARTLDANGRFAQLAAIWSPYEDFDIAVGVKRNFNTGSAVTWANTMGLTYRFR